MCSSDLNEKSSENNGSLSAKVVTSETDNNLAKDLADEECVGDARADG